MLGATFVRSPASSLDVAGSVGRSAPTDRDRFLTIRYAAVVLQQPRIHALGPSLANGVHHVLPLDVVYHSGHYTHKRSVRISDSDGISPIAYDSECEVSRSRHNRGPLVRSLRFPVVSVDDRRMM